jgi:hypothetical protein
MDDAPVSVEEMAARVRDRWRLRLATLGYEVVRQWDGYALRHRGRALAIRAETSGAAWGFAAVLQGSAEYVGRSMVRS